MRSGVAGCSAWFSLGDKVKYLGERNSAQTCSLCVVTEHHQRARVAVAVAFSCWLTDWLLHPFIQEIFTEHHYVPGCVLQSLVLEMTRIISVVLYWVLAMCPVLSWTWPGFPYSVLPPSHKVSRTTMITILPRPISLNFKFPRKNLIGPAGVMCPPLLTAEQRGWSCVTASWMQSSRR